MTHIIGPATDFYRLRLASVDATDEPEFEWRDDVLYRTPPADQPAERIEWVVEAVTLDEDETVVRLACFAEHDEARGFLERTTEDMKDLTKSGFEERYLGKA